MRSEIKSEKLILRKYEIGFIPLLFEAAYESRGGEFSHWMPWCHENYTIEESREFIEKTVENLEDETQFGYAIFDAETDKFLGGTGLNQPNKIHKMYNLGYWVRTSEQNRGIASQAAKILAKAAFEDLPELNRIEILSAVENIPSQKAAEKAGATREGDFTKTSGHRRQNSRRGFIFIRARRFSKLINAKHKRVFRRHRHLFVRPDFEKSFLAGNENSRCRMRRRTQSRLFSARMISRFSALTKMRKRLNMFAVFPK